MNNHLTHFDHIAEAYDTSLPSHVVAHYLQKRVQFITQQAGYNGLALDVGCGTGILANALSQTGWTVWGIDVSLGMLKVMKTRAQQPIQASASDIPLTANTFDVVYSVATLHHIAEPAAVRAALRAMYRVCKPGGLVIIWDHNPHNPYWPVIMARVPQDVGEERLIPIEEIMATFEHLTESAYIQAYHLGFVPDFIPAILLPTFQWLERKIETWSWLGRYVGAHNIIVVHKPVAGF